MLPLAPSVLPTSLYRAWMAVTVSAALAARAGATLSSVAWAFRPQASKASRLHRPSAAVPIAAERAAGRAVKRDSFMVKKGSK